MAIFSRRTLQRLIDENAAFLKPSQSRDHVTKLNAANERSLDTEWEVILLNMFSKVGSVTHEPQLMGTTSKPDIYFKSAHFSFIADVKAVSDEGINEQNAFNALYDRLMAIVEEKRLRANSFDLRVGGNHWQIVKGRTKPELKIPPRNRFDKEVFNDAFYRFIDDIKRSPRERRVYGVINDRLNFTITYDPQQPYASGSHLGFTGITFIDKNTIYSSLRKKAEKLIDIEGSSLLGVILCDGGCEALRSTRHFSSYHVDDVIKHFLKQFPEISFVLTVRVEQRFGHGEHNRFLTKLYLGKDHMAHANAIEATISAGTSHLPEPQRNVDNAINLLKSPIKNEGDSFNGGLTLSSNEIKISARAVLDLLAGRTTQQDFLEAHGFIGTRRTNYIGNPFAAKRQQGRLITDVKVTPGGERRDDDWLVISFGAPDPAVSPFTVPKAS